MTSTISYKKFIAFVAFVLCVYTATSKETLYYSMDGKSGTGQFITFIGDICYESNASGVTVGHGKLKRNDYNSSALEYRGNSYWGTGKFFFSKDRSKLTIVSANNQRYSFTRKTSPSGQKTCSLIRSSNQNPNNTPVNNPIYNPTYTHQGQTGLSNSNSTRTNNSGSQQIEHKRKCVFCNGTGQLTINDNPPANFGQRQPNKRCDVCGIIFNPNATNHYHIRCRHCSGTGWAK